MLVRGVAVMVGAVSAAVCVGGMAASHLVHTVEGKLSGRGPRADRWVRWEKVFYGV